MSSSSHAGDALASVPLRGLEINLYHPPEGRSFRATVALSTRATGAAQLLPFLQAQQLPLLDVAWKGPRNSCRFCIFR